MRMRVRDYREDYGLLGSIADNLYGFVNSGHDMDGYVKDKVNNEEDELTFKDYLFETQFRYIVKRKRLPFDAVVKGAYLRKNCSTADKPCFELSELDFRELGRVFEEEGFNQYLAERDPRQKSIYSFEGDLLIKTHTACVQTSKGSTRRTTVTLMPECDDYYNRDLATKIVDFIYNNNTFMPDSALEEKIGNLTTQPTGTQPIDGKPRMEMRTELQQLIGQEQVLKMVPQFNLYQKARAEALEMSGAELQNLIVRMAITRVARELDVSWREAKQLFSKMAGAEV